MRRWLLLFTFLLVAHGLSIAVTDEEKKAMFLKAREEMKTVPADKETSPSPKPRPKPKSTTKSSPIPTPTPRPAAEPSATPQATPEATASPKKPAATPATSPRKKKTSPPTGTPAPLPSPPPKLPTPEATPEETPTPRPRPLATATPTPSPTPAPTPPPIPPIPAASAPVVIQKSGYEGDAGLEPPPPPPKRSWFFGRAKEQNYRYLTASVRNEIRNARVQKRRWRYVVVHNSGTRQGNAKIFDYYHRHTRRMPNGLAYHFVIGNGTSSGDGAIEVGSRWRRQVNGGHVHSDYLNNIALGICLVGDFNRSTPTKRQLEALEELTRFLRTRVGKIDRKEAIVKAHREINPPRWPTDCPGDRFPYGWLHSRFRD